MKNTKKRDPVKKGGFTLIEMAIALLSFGIIIVGIYAILTFLVGMQANENTESYVSLNHLILDLKYDLVSSKDIDVSSNEVNIFRLDDCQVVLRYDEGEKLLMKKISCPENKNGNRDIIVDGVVFADFYREDGTICISYRLENRRITDKVCLAVGKGE